MTPLIFWHLSLMFCCFLSAFSQTCSLGNVCANQLERYCPSLVNQSSLIKFDPQTGKQIIDLSVFLLTPDWVQMAQYAVELTNNDPNLLPNHTIVLTWNNTFCQRDRSVQTAVLAFESQPTLAGVIGEACSSASESIALITPVYSMPQVSPASTDPALSAPRYSFFSRLVAPDDKTALAWVAVCQRFGWDKVLLLASTESIWQSLGDLFISEASKANITVLSETFPGEVSYDMTKQLTSLRSRAINIIFVACYPPDAASILRLANDLGMLGAPYVYIGLDAWIGQPDFIDPRVSSIQVPENIAVYDRFLEWSNGVIGILPSSKLSPEAEQVFADFRAKYNYTTSDVGVYALYTYDATMVYVYALEYMFYKRSPPWNGAVNRTFREEMFDYILKNTSFQGLTPGLVTFDPVERYRSIPYDLVFYRGGSLVVSATYDPRTKQWGNTVNDVIWNDGTTNIPVDQILLYEYIPIAVQITFQTLACAGMVIVFLFLFLTFYYWSHPRILAATPIFLVLICISTLMALSIILVIGVAPTTASCVIPHWFGHIAFYVTFSCLFFKTARVWYIFYSDIQADILIISNLQLSVVAAIPVILVLIYLAIFTAVGMPTVEYTPDPSNPRIIMVSCTYNDAWTLALYATEAALLVVCIILSWQTRKIEYLRFNESSHIAICVYALFVVGIVLIPNITWLDGSQTEKFVLESVCILIAAMTVNFALFVPKLKAIFQGKEDLDQKTRVREIGSVLPSPTSDRKPSSISIKTSGSGVTRVQSHSQQSS